MRGFEVAKVLVGKNLVEDAVGVPRRAAAHEFAISCSKRIENGIVEILIIIHKIKLIRKNHIKRGTSDCFWAVGKSLDAAAIGEVDLRFLRLKNNTGRQFVGEGCYTGYDSFGLPPRRSHYADCSVWMCNRIL